MKTTKVNATVKSMFLLGLSIMLLLTVQSCATHEVFQKSSVVPAAEGKVTVSMDRNNNYVIKIKISNLAEIERLVPEKKGYVVWMEGDQGYIRNIGLISSSNQLNVSFETVSTREPKKIFITAEEFENVQYPGPMVVLTTGIIYK